MNDMKFCEQATKFQILLHLVTQPLQMDHKQQQTLVQAFGFSTDEPCGTVTQHYFSSVTKGTPQLL